MVALSEYTLPDEGVSVYEAKHDVERVGFTALGFSLGLKRLREKCLVTLDETTDYNGNSYQVIIVTLDGWDWIEKNEDKFIIQRSLKQVSSDTDHIPF
jgi:hypothetical protein